MTFETENLKGKTLYLQQSYNGRTWSESSRYRYDEVSNTLVRVEDQKHEFPVGLAKKSMLSLDTEMHANMPLGVYQEYCQVGLGGKVQLNKAWENNFLIGASFSYTYGVSKTSRVDDFHKFQLIGIAGYELQVNKSLSLIPELGVGAMLHMSVGTVFANGSPGIYHFIDLVAEAGLKIKIHIGETLQLYTAPRFKLFVESDSIGMLAEVSVGTSVVL